MKKEKEEYKLYILTTTVEEGGELCEGESGGPYSSHEPTHRTTTFDEVYALQPSNRMFYETFELSKSDYNSLLKCEQVYVSAIFYSDGDTFGTTYGYYQITGVSASEKEAIQANNLALTDPGFKSWDGYFSSLIGPEVFLVPFKK
jgi:hypothetical protein